ncbi:unnamed protein product, partial [Closterium sp. NIES-53]
CEAEIYAGAMAPQELRWLTYLLSVLGEWHRSPPVVYVNNKAMVALCWEQRLEHKTKHIALRFFLARELQQRGQLRLAYVASQANTADIFTKALWPGDHQRFCTALRLLVVFLLLTGLGKGGEGGRWSSEVAQQLASTSLATSTHNGSHGDSWRMGRLARSSGIDGETKGRGDGANGDGLQRLGDEAAV